MKLCRLEVDRQSLTCSRQIGCEGPCGEGQVRKWGELGKSKTSDTIVDEVGNGGGLTLVESSSRNGNEGNTSRCLS